MTDITPELTDKGLNIVRTADEDSSVSMGFSESANNTGSINYQVQIGEPGRAYVTSLSAYAPSCSFAFEYPGVYQVFGSIRRSNANSFSDGAIKYITINRIAGTPVILNKDDVSITKTAQR